MKDTFLNYFLKNTRVREDIIDYVVDVVIIKIQGGSNMTGTICV
jgi:hypothetical protein